MEHSELKKVDSSRLKRAKPKVDEAETEGKDKAQPVSSPIDRVIDLAFNPSRDKIREVTVVDRLQGRLFPQLDMVNTMRHYCIEVATFRQDRDEYFRVYGRRRPIPPDALDEFLFRTAQWQKSVAGRNLDKATDIALAETEVKGGEGFDEFGDKDPWRD